MKKSLLLIMLLFLCGAVYAQQAVKGRVTSKSDGEGIPGATVVVKGTSTGTVTDIDGNYSLQVPSGNATLVFSFTGYVKQEVAVNNRSNINIDLAEDVAVLDEIVVTGYGDIKKADMTSAHVKVGAEEIQKTVNTTIEQAIQGRAAGVYVTQNSGQPGGGISVNIRGVNSINGSTEPLYVIDGVQIPGQSVSFGATSSTNPLAGLNPADIESMEVLQGPSATAVYGSRGTNGVIVITTKKGKSGDTKVSYGFQHSIQTPPQDMDVMNLQQYAQMVKEFNALEGGETPQEFLDPSILGEGTNWQDELFRTAPMNKHQLSLSGGGDKTTYYLSGEYLQQEGIAVGSGFDRYSLRLNVDNQARKWLNIGANINFSQTEEDLTTSQDNIIQTALRLPPHIPVRAIDGSWGAGSADPNSPERFIPVNPIAIATLNTNELTRRQFLGGITAAVDIIEGLQFRTSVNTNLGFGNNVYFRPKYRLGYNENPTTRLSETSSLNTYWNWNQLVQYQKQLGRHSINVMASHESQASTWKNLGAEISNFVTEEVIDLNFGDITTALNSGGQGDWAMESYLGRIIYNFDERYILQGAVRADGSSNFGPENRWGYFPSVSAAWRVSEEGFFNVPFINDFKLRFETGLTGNQGGGQYIYSSLNPVPSGFGTSYMPSRYGNPNLQWESTLTNNIGINLSLFKNRIQLEADYYIKNTDNLLLENPLPNVIGTGSSPGAPSAPFVNIGSLQNKGWSFAINTINIDKGGFTWNSNLNLSGFKTTIEEFALLSAHIDRTSWWMNNWTQRAVVGESPWLFRGYIIEGIFQSVEEIESSPRPVDNNGELLPVSVDDIWVGDYKFKDVNEDGIIDHNDITNIGNPWPKMFAGFTNNFSYKGFDLSILITSTIGNDIYNYVAFQNTNPNNVNLRNNMMVEALDYAKIAYADDDVDQERPYLLNPGTEIARLNINGPNDNFNRHSSRYVEDGSFVRLKNVSLGYNLPAKLLQRSGFIQGARISFSAQNVATITGYTGYDPEVGAYVGRDVQATNQAIGVDNGRYPLTPVYSFSLGIDF
ncbi:TonB-dependent receptor [Cesiribacter sp. SM1]|uniref:SusC/RagA family TonB-linked outer membrane protein n=1 Tax=Cesiribacter sp. SM1 TaxID=2861196 RepID=UPI001CD7BE81|nr:TonB-dependent receptor [Cesiribacter sp. SM1]